MGRSSEGSKGRPRRRGPALHGRKALCTNNHNVAGESFVAQIVSWHRSLRGRSDAEPAAAVARHLRVGRLTGAPSGRRVQRGHRAPQQRRQHEHRLRAGHERCDPICSSTCSKWCMSAATIRSSASASPEIVLASTTSGNRSTAARIACGGRAGPAVQLDVALDRPPQCPRLQPHGEPADRPAGPQPVHAALDRRRREPDAAADVGEAAAGVLDEQGDDLLVDGVEAHAHSSHHRRRLVVEWRR